MLAGGGNCVMDDGAPLVADGFFVVLEVLNSMGRCEKGVRPYQAAGS